MFLFWFLTFFALEVATGKDTYFRCTAITFPWNHPNFWEHGRSSDRDQIFPVPEVCKYHDVASQILKRCPAAREAVCAKSPAHEVEKLREQLRSESFGWKMNFWD